jgi:hypothetical protein
VSASVRMLFFVANMMMFISGCGTAVSEVPTRSRFDVVGVLKLSDEQRAATQTRTPQFSLLDEKGERRILAAESVAFDSASGRFAFTVDRKDFFRNRGLSPAETLAALGQLSPANAIPAQGFRKSELGFLRFEVFTPPESSSTSVIPLYLQRWMSLPVLSRFRGKDVLTLESEVLEPKKVSLVRARIVDAQARPIVGALVTVVPLLNSSNREGDAELLDFTREVNFTPVSSYSDSEGKVSLWPVPWDIQGNKQFQLIASSNGTCSASSSPTTAHENHPELVLQLQECTKEQKNGSDPAWDVSLLNPLARLEVATATLPSGTYLTNGDSVELEFKSKSSVKRGFRVRIYEGTKAEGTLLSQQIFKVFSPRIKITLPASFKDRTSTRGSFVILVESLLSAKDVENGMKAARATFTFDKIVRSLNTVFSNRFQVIGASGVENVISGNAMIPFVVKYLDCSEGMKFAISFSDSPDFSSPPVWQTCQPLGNSMTLADLGLQLNAVGGFKNVAFFLKDRYENVSRDDPQNAINRRSNIWLDFGSPDLSSLALGSDLDIVPANATLPIGTKPAPVQLQTSNVSQHILAFRQNTCAAVPGADAVADGNDPSLGRGQKISKFFVGSTRSRSEMLGAAVSCETSGFSLSDVRVLFPAAASSDPATFQLTVFDLAGNAATRTFSVPRCTGGAAPPENVCWSP